MKVLLAIFGIGLIALSGANAADFCEQLDAGYAYPNPKSCELFYLCVDKISEERKCNFGLHFSPTKLYCQRPEVANCSSNIPDPSPELPDCRNLEDGETFEKSGDCEKFYICSDQKAEVKNCKSGLHYNAKKKFCEQPELAGCDTRVPDCKNLEDGETFEKPGDCGKFYICTNQEAEVKNCKSGLHYNAKKKYCEDPALAGCDSNITPTPTTTTESIPTTTTESTPTTTTESTPTKTTESIPTTTLKPPVLDPKICKGHPLGKKIPYPGVCTKYITCIGGGVVKVCPDGLHFNAEKEVCDWPESANCPWA